MRRTWLLLTLGILISACAADRERVHIGAQPFTEQAILAQMLQQLIEDNTNLRVSIVSCDNTYACALPLCCRAVCRQ